MQNATPIGRTQHVARGLLHDFAASGVDEDLEMLKAQWSKPPPQPASSGAEDDEFIRVSAAASRPNHIHMIDSLS